MCWGSWVPGGSPSLRDDVPVNVAVDGCRGCELFAAGGGWCPVEVGDSLPRNACLRLGLFLSKVDGR